MNDWLDYKGSGSYRAYANEDESTMAHAFNFRRKIDKGVKAIGDAATLPFIKTAEFGRQLQAYADLLAAKRELYDSLAGKANKFARSVDERQYEQYKREAEKVKSDIDKIKKEVDSDIDKYRRHIENNAILGPIIKSIENNAKTSLSIMKLAVSNAADNVMSRRNSKWD